MNKAILAHYFLTDIVINQICLFYDPKYYSHFIYLYQLISYWLVIDYNWSYISQWIVNDLKLNM